MDNLKKKSRNAFSQPDQADSNKNTAINQKKIVIKRKSKCRDLSEKFNDPYISTIIIPTRKNEEYECKICGKSAVFSYKNIKRHLLESETHMNKVPLKDKEAHDILIEKVRNSIKLKESKDQENTKNQNSKGYIEF